MSSAHPTWSPSPKVSLKDRINAVRFWITRPDWWRGERDQLAFLSKCFKRGDLCFDVGANGGNYSRWLLTLGARVVAVEPQPAAATYFTTYHAESLAKGTVRLVEAALGTEDGTVEMLCPVDGSEISSLSERWIETVRESHRFEGHSWDRKTTVKVTTLDKLIETYGLPTFCKIDVEGYEPEVLKGLSRPISFLSFEYTPEFSGHVTSCLQELSRIGEYRYNFVVHSANGGHHQFEWPEFLATDEALSRLEGPTSEALKKGGDVYCRLVKARA